MVKRILSVLLLCALWLTVLAACGEQREGEQLYRAPEAGDYFYGRILLVMTRGASLKFHTYTVADFPEIDCVAVQDFSTGAAAIVKRCLLEAGVDLSSIDENTSFASYKIEERYRRVVNNYNQVLCIDLTCADEEEAKEALERLLQREDVQSAEFDRVISLID